LRSYFQTYAFPVLFTRASNVYGPGQQLYRIIPRTVLAAIAGQKLKLDGGGKSVRVFIHMRDVSDATLKVATNGRPGESYHISGYRIVSIRQLVEMILGMLGKSFDECVEIGPDRPGKDSAYTLDSVKIRTELGWQDRITLEDGIADVIAWARRFSRVLDRMPIRYEHKP
jgi:dTDP-glucose 4,6-dehydratase